MRGLSQKELVDLQAWMGRVLAKKIGADQNHRPLFRKFPEDVPENTEELWFRRVLCHFLQDPEQPCLFCARVGTTHVLSPCRHIVCGHCFDGSHYSACPVCERRVDESSPFFAPSGRENDVLPDERVTFSLIDLGDDLESEARALFVSFCERKQAMSPSDRKDFETLLDGYGECVLEWLPETIPVRENVAVVFGRLFRASTSDQVLVAARKYFSTATDVLRFLAAYSGADPSLQRQTVLKQVRRLEEPGALWSTVHEVFTGERPGPRLVDTWLPIRRNRFKMAPLPRPLRRSLLALLDSLDPDALVEDMLRHRSYWVWAGEFLHPHDYQNRFPNVARAFEVVRKRLPDGGEPLAFRTFYSRLEEAASRGDASAMTRLLRERPGELARRFDHALRVAAGDAGAVGELVEAFSGSVGRFSTPVLLTLRNHLPRRLQKAPVRIYWPKGAQAKGVSSEDERPPLPERAVRRAVRAVETELLDRFARETSFPDCLIDEGLKEIVAPFNERTASPSAVVLPRGSRVPVPLGKVARLFLHWCEPRVSGHRTDLDLSVGLYDASWRYVGVCSYYELTFNPEGVLIAKSAGDLQSAPFPDGATEFVDLHVGGARKIGIRYAVMVVNAYAGMPFGALERSFAGISFREDLGGKQFDPRTVELKFELQGVHGTYLPLVLDLDAQQLHWLDTYSKGLFAYNNVETSNNDIRKICPEMMIYFESGVRVSMFELALLHAAARGRRVFLRDYERTRTRLLERRDGESALSFFERLLTERGAIVDFRPERPCFAALYKGDRTLPELPEGSLVYALFRERLTGTVSASELIV